MTERNAPKELPLHHLTIEVVNRFHSKYTVNDDGCWIWNHVPPGCGGYGRLSIHNKQYRAHRVSYVIHSGQDIPDGMYIDHLCKVRACVNPQHLEVVTHRVNISRSDSPPATAVLTVLQTGRCPRGHDMTAPDAWRQSKGTRRVCRRCRNEDRTATRRRAAARAVQATAS